MSAFFFNLIFQKETERQIQVISLFLNSDNFIEIRSLFLLHLWLYWVIVKLFVLPASFYKRSIFIYKALIN